MASAPGRSSTPTATSPPTWPATPTPRPGRPAGLGNTPAGITTRYTYWPDHTRRTATTTGGGPTPSRTTTPPRARSPMRPTPAAAPGHGDLVLPTGRASRGPHPDQAATGNGPATAQDTGPGTGYYLSDAHGSVEALVDGPGRSQPATPTVTTASPTGASPTLLATRRRPRRQRRGQPVRVRRRLHQPQHRHPVPARPHLRPGPGPVPVSRRRRPDQPLPGLRHQPRQQHRPQRPARHLPVGQRRHSASPCTSSPPRHPEPGCHRRQDHRRHRHRHREHALRPAPAHPPGPPYDLVSGATNLGAAAAAATSLANEGRRSGKGFLSGPAERNLSTAATFFLGAIAGATGVAAGATDLAGKDRARSRLRPQRLLSRPGGGGAVEPLPVERRPPLNSRPPSTSAAAVEAASR